MTGHLENLTVTIPDEAKMFDERPCDLLLAILRYRANNKCRETSSEVLSFEQLLLLVAGKVDLPLLKFAVKDFIKDDFKLKNIKCGRDLLGVLHKRGFIQPGDMTMLHGVLSFLKYEDLCIKMEDQLTARTTELTDYRKMLIEFGRTLDKNDLEVLSFLYKLRTNEPSNWDLLWELESLKVLDNNTENMAAFKLRLERCNLSVVLTRIIVTGKFTSFLYKTDFRWRVRKRVEAELKCSQDLDVIERCLKNRYHQIELDDSFRFLTVLSTHDGLFQFRRFYFGVNSAAEQFQNLIQSVLASLFGVINLSDDILVYGINSVEHNENLKNFCQRLREKNLTLNKRTCEFNKDTVEFFGHV
ncbi:uncharacterized protein LOC117121622 [Anneissia japonica]|uniref:uncharacterized protein LOC117121622 n=1 Tax=Anneissia japonica TaxID=1529436 RepID=UPI00142586FC|nr:uncharacterized protein LOC117121622 [Anneissia japonica]